MQQAVHAKGVCYKATTLREALSAIIQIEETGAVATAFFHTTHPEIVTRCSIDKSEAYAKKFFEDDRTDDPLGIRPAECLT